MYAVTSIWLVRRTRAILRSAEFGFLGVIVRTWRQTPRFCGAPGIGTWRWRRLFQFLRIAGALILEILARRPWRTSWLIVGTKTLPLSVYWLGARQDGRERSLAEPTDPGDTKAEFSKWRNSVSNVVRTPRTAHSRVAGLPSSLTHVRVRSVGSFARRLGLGRSSEPGLSTDSSSL